MPNTNPRAFPLARHDKNLVIGMDELTFVALNDLLSD